MTAGQLRIRTDGLKHRLAVAESAAHAERIACAKAGKEFNNCTAAHALVQKVAADVQAAVHGKITTVVSKCLAAVFDQPYTFKIEVKKARGRTEAVCVLERDGRVLTDPLFEAGGGVADVAAFALRVACLSLRPGVRKLLVADEPMKFVNGVQYQNRVAAMLLTLAKETGFQFVISSDDDWLQIGNVVKL